MSLELARNIKAFDAQKTELEKHHMGKFVVFHDAIFAGAYDTFDAAAHEAVRRFGGSVFLIRQVGSKPEMPVPASVAFNPVHASH
jgi:hypothetical protein